MPEVLTERVLVVPTEVFHRLGHFQGFTDDVDRYLTELFSPENASYRPRGEVEVDPGFKQLIPYVVFCHQDEAGRLAVFQYTRGTGQGEGRQGDLAIGLKSLAILSVALLDEIPEWRCLRSLLSAGNVNPDQCVGAGGLGRRLEFLGPGQFLQQREEIISCRWRASALVRQIFAIEIIEAEIPAERPVGIAIPETAQVQLAAKNTGMNSSR